MYKILVVDDEKDITESIRNGLSKYGFDVDAYVEPEKALSEFEFNKYDLALLDFKMPKMNGFDLFSEL